jgi:glycosyltransferase involved in cell wall biosynthesis
MKFSVIIPAYNAEQYIRTAIESCLSQTYAPHEIIVVDDSSTDGTAAVAESFPSLVRVIRLAENRGASFARNRGVQEASGDWLAFLDADDWFLPEKLELQRRCALENQQTVLIYTGIREIAIDGSEREHEAISPMELWPRLRYLSAIEGGASTAAVRRDAFDAVGGFDDHLRVCDDWNLWLKLALRYSVKSFASVPVSLAVYRRVAGSLSSNAMRYFNARSYMIDNLCLAGTAGLSRLLWRRKLTAFQYYTTSIALREEDSSLDLRFILRSLVLWPFPSFTMSLKRYRILTVMVRQHLSRRLLR